MCDNEDQRNGGDKMASIGCVVLLILEMIAAFALLWNIGKIPHWKPVFCLTGIVFWLSMHLYIHDLARYGLWTSMMDFEIHAKGRSVPLFFLGAAPAAILLIPLYVDAMEHLRNKHLQGILSFLGIVMIYILLTMTMIGNAFT